MIDINLEIKNVKAKQITKNRISLEIESVLGERLTIYLSTEDGEMVHDELERVCVSEEYRYENMEVQLSEARDRIDELEEILECLEAVQ